MMNFRINDTGYGTEKKTSLNSHAALPDIGNFRQVVVVVCPIKEKDIPKASADNAGQAAAKGEVEDVKVPMTPVFFHNVIGRNA